MGSGNSHIASVQGKLSSATYSSLSYSTRQLMGYYVPELMHVVKPMLNDRPEGRPTSSAVLRAFDKMVSLIGKERPQMICCDCSPH